MMADAPDPADPPIVLPVEGDLVTDARLAAEMIEPGSYVHDSALEADQAVMANAARLLHLLADRQAVIAAAVEEAGGADRVRAMADYYADPTDGNDAEAAAVLRAVVGDAVVDGEGE